MPSPAPGVGRRNLQDAPSRSQPRLPFRSTRLIRFGVPLNELEITLDIWPRSLTVARVLFESSATVRQPRGNDSPLNEGVDTDAPRAQADDGESEDGECDIEFISRRR